LLISWKWRKPNCEAWDDEDSPLLVDLVRWLLLRYLKKVAEELNALADAAQVDRTALFAMNLALEVLSFLACSCLATAAERSVDQKVRLARNLDWPGGDLLAEAGLVVIESGSGHRFASFIWPGLVSLATGMNDAGLAVADLMAPLVQSAGMDKVGVPDLQRILAESAIVSMNVQSVIVEPESRRACVAQGKVPIAKGAWKTLELSPWLRKSEN